MDPCTNGVWLQDGTCASGPDRFDIILQKHLVPDQWLTLDSRIHECKSLW